MLWAKEKLENIGCDSVWLQDVMVPYWVRGDISYGAIVQKDVVQQVPICALGGSVPTPKGGITAEVLKIYSLQELERLGRKKIEGKIVFFNRPMNPLLINTFHAYGGCVDQRSQGASEAAKYGAVAVIVRSMNLLSDDYPHTGSMSYDEGIPKIPAAAISTNAARLLSRLVDANKNLSFKLEMNCETKPDTLSHNVVGEIRGSLFPDEIIVVGGHLDSWDLGQGAHDDGAGCVQSMDVLNIFKLMGHRPERTIRCVLFMNEENGIRGALKYAELAKENGEKHVFAIESDNGGFSPRGFRVDGPELVKQELLKMIKSWSDLFEPYNLHKFEYGYSGVDIGRLKDQNTGLIGLEPDNQRYFDYHHAATDNIEAVNKRELELGTASIASLVYLLSKYGINVSP